MKRRTWAIIQAGNIVNLLILLLRLNVLLGRRWDNSALVRGKCATLIPLPAVGPWAETKVWYRDNFPVSTCIAYVE